MDDESDNFIKFDFEHYQNCVIEDLFNLFILVPNFLAMSISDIKYMKFILSVVRGAPELVWNKMIQTGVVHVMSCMFIGLNSIP